MKYKKFRRRMLRVIAMVLLVASVAGIAPLFADAADSDDLLYTKVAFYEWHRIVYQKKDDYTGIPPELNTRYPLLLIWKRSGTYYVADGPLNRTYHENRWSEWPAAGSRLWLSEGRQGNVPTPEDGDGYTDITPFFTRGTPSSWGIEFTGKFDSDNGNMPIARIYFDETHMIDGHSHWSRDGIVNKVPGTEMTIELGKYDSPGVKWYNFIIPSVTLLLSELLKKEKWIQRDYIRIFHNQSGATDTWFSYYDDRVWGDKSWASLKWLDFNAYWGEKVYFTCLNDTVVSPGQVMDIQDGAILNDGCTLYIAPGATVVVGGQFYNNGLIENHGTLVLKDGACISSFIPADKGKPVIDNKYAPNSIVCDGTPISTEFMIDLSLKQNRKLMETLNGPDGLFTKAKEAKEKADAALQTAQDDLARYERNNAALLDAAFIQHNQLIEKYADPLDDAVNERKAAEQTISACKAALETLKTDLAEPHTETEKVELQKQQSEVQKQLDAATKALGTENDKTGLWGVEKEKEAAYKKALEELNASEGMSQLIELQNKVEAAAKAQAEVMAEYELRQSQYDSVQSTIDALEKMPRTQEKLAGEGNMIIMGDAKVFLDQGSSMDISGGGSLVCNGLLFVPDKFNMDNAKLEIRQEGVLMTGYQLTKDMASIRNCTILNPNDITKLNLSMGAKTNSTYANSHLNESPIITTGMLGASGTGSVILIDGKWVDIGRQANSLYVLSEDSKGQVYSVSGQRMIYNGIYGQG